MKFRVVDKNPLGIGIYDMIADSDSATWHELVMTKGRISEECSRQPCGSLNDWMLTEDLQNCEQTSSQELQTIIDARWTCMGDSEACRSGSGEYLAVWIETGVKYVDWSCTSVGLDLQSEEDQTSFMSGSRHTPPPNVQRLGATFQIPPAAHPIHVQVRSWSAPIQ